jgi:hypothetical protein
MKKVALIGMLVVFVIGHGKYFICATHEGQNGRYNVVQQISS